MSDFVSLHGHTDFSLRDAMSTPSRMAERLNAIDQKAIAVTDHGNMCAIAVVDKTLKKHGLKLIAGNEMYVASKGTQNTEDRDTAHITLLAMDMEGYRNLCKLHSMSWQRPAYFYNPRTDLDLLAEHSKGLICLSGCIGGVLLKPLLKGDEITALERIRKLKQIFGKRFFIEIQDHRLPEDEMCRTWLESAADEFKLPVVATTDYHYVLKEDWKAHDRLIACGMNQKVNDPNRSIVYNPGEFYIKSYADMAERFEKSALVQSKKIADMCEPLKLDSAGVFHLPVVDKDGIKALRDLAWRGVIKRYKGTDQKIRDRFEYELAAIEKGGFTQYLLLMADMYRFMKEKGIPYGPGRGSSAASIVCYALGITGLDPLEYDLLFERFINPERVSAPDIDCDISAERRQEVIDYLKERWGEDRVAQIVTFGTLGARAGIKDMARVMDKPKELGPSLAKHIPKNGSLTTDREEREYIDEALQKVPAFTKLYKDSVDAHEVIDAAREVEGIIRNASLHAAGVVIADKPISDYAPMMTAAKKDDKERKTAVAYAMNELEAIGLIKFDLLGLIKLDTIDKCVRWMKEDKVVPERFDISEVPLDDAKTFALLGKGLTAGVFQFESSGMAGWLRKLKPDHIDDLIAMVALYRPGPMAFIGDYIDRKHGKQRVEYPDPSLETTLRSTYGIAVFQEQLMQIGVVVAGWSLARADQLRKVIGKKIIDKIAGERKQFADDAAKNGYEWEWADKLFEQFIEPAAKYSFNKGHASVYGFLAYQTAWLKANHPVYYFGSLLAEAADDKDKVASYIVDARAMGIAILPPDVNESGLTFTALPEKQAVRYGLSAIKNVGEKAVKLIIKERKHGPYTDLFDFVSRTRDRLVTTRTIDSLILAGAIDSLPGDRHRNLASIDNACLRFDMLAEDRDRVAAGGAPVKRRKLIPDAVLVRPNEDILSIKLLPAERDLLGVYLSGHPIDEYGDLTPYTTCDLQTLRDMGPGNSATVAGIVSAAKLIVTKSKLRMWKVTIEDASVSQDVIVFPKQTRQTGDMSQYLDQAVVMYGRLEEDDDDEDVAHQFILEKLYTPDDAPVVRKVETGFKWEQRTLTYDNYEEVIAKSFGRVTFILPDGMELQCAN